MILPNFKRKIKFTCTFSNSEIYRSKILAKILFDGWQIPPSVRIDWTRRLSREEG